MKYSFDDLKLVVNNPNFTIILPTDCNADCSFCSWKSSGQNKQRKEDNFFIKLLSVLEKLPDEFKQITISGGEPTLYKDLDSVLRVIEHYNPDKIEKVVFTTNGHNLKQVINLNSFKNVVDYVNISRHAICQNENNKIFNTKTITFDEIKDISLQLEKIAIPVNINCVLSSDIKIKYFNNFVHDFIHTARNNGINSITFRCDYKDGHGLHYLEKQLGKPKAKSVCPVCRKYGYIIDYFPIFFCSSKEEPKETYGENRLYEMILQPNGKLTLDWEGFNEVCLDKKIKTTIKYDTNYTQSSRNGCGGGGC